MENLVRHLIWIVFFLIALAGIYALLKFLGIM